MDGYCATIIKRLLINRFFLLSIVKTKNNTVNKQTEKEGIIMVIIKTTNNEAIVKQLTELLNKSFENSLDDTIKNHNSVQTIKKSIKGKTVVDEGTLLAGFIEYWINNTFYDSVFQYAQLMRSSYSNQLYKVFKETAYQEFIEKELYSYSFSVEKKPSLFFEQTIIPLTIRVKEHNGSIEEALLAIVKPVLVEEFVVELINQSETTVELLSIVKNYNDYDYHLERFISVFENNLLNKKEHVNQRLFYDEYVNPLELLGVWSLDRTFLKETIIPELKKRTLTDEQKQKAAIHSSCKDLVNNYYDYCLYYACAEDHEFITGDLIDTVFFYEKVDFDHAVSIIKKALSVNEELEREDVQGEHSWLLKRAGELKPEWLDSLNCLLKGSY